MFTELDGSKGSLGAELIDMSGNFLRRKLFSCSYAFIQEWIYWDNSTFSYPLYYLDNSTAFLKDDWASTSTPPVVRLSWSLGAENCSQAQLNSSTYACQDNKSVCLDYADEYTDEEFKGYFCRCVEGYEGNPYLPKGCRAFRLNAWRTLLWEISKWRETVGAIGELLGYISKLLLAFVFYFIRKHPVVLEKKLP